MVNNSVTYIPNRLKSAAKGGFVTGAGDIIDDNLEKNQEELNEFFDDITHDVYRKGQVNNLISRTPETDVVIVGSISGTIIGDICPHDENDWEMGTLSSIDGSTISSSNRCRTISYIQVHNASSFIISQIPEATPIDNSIYFYDSDHVYLDSTSYIASGIITPPEGTEYIKFVVRPQGDVSSVITPEIAAAGSKCEMKVGHGLDDIPVEDRPNKLFRVPGPTNTTFSEWAWDGTQWIMLDNKDYGIDEEPLPESDNMAKSSGISLRLMNNMMVGKGNTYTTSKIVGLIHGRKYRLTLDDPNYDRSAVTNQGVLFRISSFHNDTETILYNVAMETDRILNQIEFVVPNNSDYIEVGGRANEDEKVRFHIHDLYAYSNIENKIANAYFENRYVYDVYTKGMSVFKKNDVKIPICGKSGDLIEFSFDSDNIDALDYAYVKYENSAEETNIKPSSYYFKNGRTYQFVATDDIEYFTFITDTFTQGSQLVFTFVIRDIKIGISREYWDIYKSETDNLLDVNNVLRGISIDNETYIVSEDKNGIISRPIYLGDLAPQKITISGWDAWAKRAIYFLSEANLDQSCIIDGFNLSNEWQGVRTITVPVNSKYVVVCLRNKDDYQSSVNGLRDYSNIKIAIGEDAAIQAFKGKPSFNALDYDGIIYSSFTNNILDTSRQFTDLRLTDDPPYFVNNTTPIVTCNATYIKGIKQITFRVQSISDTRKWILFTTDRSRTQGSVVGIEYIPVNSDGALQELTFNVPSNAVWMYVTLCTWEESMETAMQMTCAAGDKPTTDEYKKAVGGFMGLPIGIINKDNNGDDSGSGINSIEAADTWKRYLPYSIGAPATENNKAPFSGGYQRAHILFFTDNHIDYITPAASLDNVRSTISFVNDGKITFDAAINAGDAITPFGEVSKTGLNGATERLTTFFNECKNLECPFLFAKGNHDSNDWNNTPANALDDDDWSSLIYNYMESEYGFVRQTKANGKKSSYGYYDITAHKIRVLVVDVQDIDRTPVDGSGHCKYYGGNAFHISDEQFQWMANNALSFNEDGWGVIIVLHQTFTQNGVWYSVENMPSSIQKFYNMVKAFNNHTTFVNEAYTYVPDSFYDLSAFTKDFSFGGLTDKPRVICWLMGHEHFDRVVTQDGMNLIWTLNGSANDSSSDQRVPKIIGTSTQNAFDVISIDTKLHKIWYVRYGTGKNCYGVGGDRFLPDGLSY